MFLIIQSKILKDMNHIKIRQGEPKDLETIVEFMIQMAEETENLELNYDVVTHGVKNAIFDEHKGRYYLAEIDDEVVGCLMITKEWSDWRNAWVFWMQSVYIDKNFRKQGVFKALYNYVLKMASENVNVAGTRLYVDLRNTKAIDVYQKIGMNGGHYQVFEKMKE